MAANESTEGAVLDTPVGFTIVVPSLNQGRFIADALNSLLNQGYPRLEIIVVDGGSTDETLEILRSYHDRIHWICEKDKGQADALKKGFAMAKREWLSWLNSDDVQSNGALFRVQEAIKENPTAQVIVGQGHYIGESGDYLRPYPTVRIDPGVDVMRELFEKGYLAQPSVFFHRAAYEAVGGIDPTLHYVLDYDLFVRLARRNCRFVAVGSDISGNRWHPSAKTASQLLPLYGEAAFVQNKEYRRVSAYFVQAISDCLYENLWRRHRSDEHHLFYRTMYFKAVWLWLNLHRPFHCLWGLLAQNIAKSGPIVGDKLTFVEMLQLLLRALRHRLARASS
jgi:glycosyltransferase involved in cell wall biosynthesis